jgi:uncharacterized protein YjeT (DUF2065 family)
MTVPTMIEWFAGLMLVVIGLSHIVQPRVWADLFIDLLRKPHAGLYIGMLTLPLGLLIVVGHNIWAWKIPVIVTLLGWGWTIKGSLYLMYPATPQKVAPRHLAHPERFAIAGAAIVALGAVVLIHLIIAPAA